MNKYIKEIVLWILIVLPYIYLCIIWSHLPERVPTHFNLEGKADDWSGKDVLLYLPGVVGPGIYFLMLLIPVLDPKKKIAQMGDKYYSLRFMLSFFFSLIMCYLLYVSQAGSLQNSNLLITLIGVLFAMLGNYFQALRPNYFIGIRTPWTLESEGVWKKTHRLGGRLWMAGGTAIAILSLVLSGNQTMAVIFGSLLAVMVLIPIIYSYKEFQKEKEGK